MGDRAARSACHHLAWLAWHDAAEAGEEPDHVLGEVTELCDGEDLTGAEWIAQAIRLLNLGLADEEDEALQNRIDLALDVLEGHRCTVEELVEAGAVICGALDCGGPAAWVDPDGLGWCEEHSDVGLHDRPDTGTDTDHADVCPVCAAPMGEVPEPTEYVGGGWVCLGGCGFYEVHPWTCLCGVGWLADGPRHSTDCPCWDPLDPDDDRDDGEEE